MSLVNEMLQELDRRNAADSQQAAPGAVLAQSIRPMRRASVWSEWFWRALALLMIVALGWVGWVAWHLMPRSNVTEIAVQSARLRPPAQPAAQVAPSQASSSLQPARPDTGAAPEPAPPPKAHSAPGPTAAGAGARSARPETLTLARELRTPVKEPMPRAASAPAGAGKQTPAAKKAPAPLPIPPQAIEPRGPLAKAQAPAPTARAAPASGEIERRDSSTPRERAEAEFRRAVTFVNQGRMAEGMEAFRAALSLDPGYETARQTQVSLLLDAKRMDEAASSLQEGIALNPSNVTFAMLLARIIVERGDLRGALAMLQRHAPAAADNAEYHAFAAALYQRLGRHKEAGDEYQKALRLAPQSGAWWVGLGISLESQQRPKDAGEAFRRARSAGSLTPELAGYVEQRLKALP
jgi:MSHA biogenesis protein MshN